MIEVKMELDSAHADTIRCKKCGSVDTYFGYGFAAGGCGGYAVCMGCGEILETYPDPEASECTTNDCTKPTVSNRGVEE